MNKRKKRVLVISDLDDTLTRTNNENNGIVPDKFKWAPYFRGDSFFKELVKRHPENWRELFFSLYNPSNIDKKVLREFTLNSKIKHNKFKNFIILTAGIRYIQLNKIYRLGLGNLTHFTVPKSREKTTKIIEIIKKQQLLVSDDIKKIIIAEDRPKNIDKDTIQIETQIPVNLIKVELTPYSPNLELIK